MVFLFLLFNFPIWNRPNLLSSCWDSDLLMGHRWVGGPAHGPKCYYPPVPKWSHKCKFPSRCPITPSPTSLNQPFLLPLHLKGHMFHLKKKKEKEKNPWNSFPSPLISSVVGVFPGFQHIMMQAGQQMHWWLAFQLGQSFPFGDLLHDQCFSQKKKCNVLMKEWVPLVLWLNSKHDLFSSLSFMKTM